ncbi:MAG: protein kinase domain-containing protein, partial [Gemmatimonadales bacterium]
QALVADFGIALAVDAAEGGSEGDAKRLTSVGVSVGTPQYMSPEQAAGDRKLDARSDIYSLGAVTYEMLTGEPPHLGSSVQAISARIIAERPSPIAWSRDLVPTNVEAAVRRALAKSPADRFSRAAQFADALTDPGFRLPDTGEVAPPARRRIPRWAGAAALVPLSLAIGWIVRAAQSRSDEPNPGPPAVFYLSMDSGSVVPGYPALSPDGRVLVYPGGVAGASQLYLRRLENPNPQALTETEEAHSPFFSPDGAWVAFQADQAIKKRRLADGRIAIIAPYAEGLAGATWGENGRILLATMPTGALFQVSDSGGTPAPVAIAGERMDSGYFFPHYLPGGHAIVYNTLSTGGRLGVLDLRTGKRRTFGPALRPQYLARGRLVYANPEGLLVSQSFDLGRLEPTGPPEVLPEVLGVGRGRAFYSVSREGTLAVIRGQGTILDVALYDRRGGNPRVLLRNAGWAPRFSPDGSRIAYGDGIPDDVWIYELATGAKRRLTTEGTSSNDPQWSPDGRELAYDSDRPSQKDLLVRNADGTGAERRVVVRAGLQWPSDWSSTGYIVYTEVSLDENRDIWAVKADGSEPPFVYRNSRFWERGAQVSPDGRWIAYDSNESGEFEVFVDGFPRPSRSPLRISRGGGQNPRWGPAGGELFYWNGNELIAARLDLRSSPSVLGRSTVLTTSYAAADHPQFDVHPDGNRFVILNGRPRPEVLLVAINPFPATP